LKVTFKVTSWKKSSLTKKKRKQKLLDLAVEFVFIMPAASSTQGQSTSSEFKVSSENTFPSSEFKVQSENMDHLVKEIAENLKLAEAAASVVAASGGHGGHVNVGGPYDHDNPYATTGNPVVNSFKLKSSFGRRGHHHRSSPYAVPPSSRACDTTLGSSPTSRGPSQLRKWNHQRRRYPSTCMSNNGGTGGPGSDRDNGIGKNSNSDQDSENDPFQMLQELISDGSLIKEAVRRLQKGLYPTPPGGISPPTPTHNNANKTFYDSEDDEFVSRTPPNLCCEVGL